MLVWKGGKAAAIGLCHDKELNSAVVKLQLPGLILVFCFLGEPFGFCLLTIIFFAVLLHVDLQFAFRRLAIGLAI